MINLNLPGTTALSENALVVLESVNKKLGRVPAMYTWMAQSPAALDAYVKFNSALSQGSLGSKMAELIALATAEYNQCSYCLSAHSHFGKKVGLSESEMADGRRLLSDDAKRQAGLNLVKKMLESPGQLSEADVEPMYEAHYTPGEVIEIIANVVRNIYTNYLNTLLGVPNDWPTVVEPLIERR
jgi:uncharacterized peroxidase-related enzyme